MIYKTDILECNTFMQSNAVNFKRGLFFVLATIQQKLEMVPAIVTDFESIGSDSRYAFGSKSKGIEYINGNYCQLYQDAILGKNDPDVLLELFLRIPGLGLVKAGFTAQLFNNLIGCIDTHNIKLYGIALSALRYRYKSKPNTLALKRADYIGLCEALGGSAFLWSQWCDHVARIRPNNWENGKSVSQYHVDVITGLEDGKIVDLFSGVDFTPSYAISGV